MKNIESSPLKEFLFSETFDGLLKEPLFSFQTSFIKYAKGLEGNEYWENVNNEESVRPLFSAQLGYKKPIRNHRLHYRYVVEKKVESLSLDQDSVAEILSQFDAAFSEHLEDMRSLKSKEIIPEAALDVNDLVKYGEQVRTVAHGLGKKNITFQELRSYIHNLKKND
ncbi:MAG: hypothetical protein WD335_00110 [Candidatus Paceibacterota bacterium]